MTAWRFKQFAVSNIQICYYYIMQTHRICLMMSLYVIKNERYILSLNSNSVLLCGDFRTDQNYTMFNCNLNIWYPFLHRNSSSEYCCKSWQKGMCLVQTTSKTRPTINIEMQETIERTQSRSADASPWILVIGRSWSESSPRYLHSFLWKAIMQAVNDSKLELKIFLMQSWSVKMILNSLDFYCQSVKMKATNYKCIDP